MLSLFTQSRCRLFVLAVSLLFGIVGISCLVIFQPQKAESILSEAIQQSGWSVAAINYRGFGLSEGAPTQENAFNDAALIYDYFIQRQDIDRERIVPMGYSLGTGAAVHLSNLRATKGTVLVAPFHNRTDKISRLFHLSYFPMSVIFKQPFNSISVP
ncbi:lysophospholipase [Paenibacillus doosanensis]|uniref:alpha/beta hydrolase n=1 Tax=Paenibacillus doosanensis TaxID=1229154 RepID=UPI0021807081|nr:lysophospholipase [Paenibacillus doosanensis]MCS7459844.1 lysophospholipase [Paenibacillus doosanensis]